MKFCQTVTKNLPGDVVLHTIYQVCQTVLRFGRIGDIRWYYTITVLLYINMLYIDIHIFYHGLLVY